MYTTGQPEPESPIWLVMCCVHSWTILRQELHIAIGCHRYKIT